MLDGSAPDRLVVQLPYGTHQIRWNLEVLLYKGGAGMRRSDSELALHTGTLAGFDAARSTLIEKFHDVLAAKIARGASPPGTILQLESLWRFTSWADSADASLTLDSVKSTFSQWTEVLIHRYRVLKDLAHLSAYSEGARVADLVARALMLPNKRPGAALLRHTRLRVPNLKKHVLGTKADKQNLSETFTFGHVLADICKSLDADNVRGRLPVTITLSSGSSFIIAGRLHTIDRKLDEIGAPSRRDRARKARAALDPGASAVDDTNRSTLLNRRIEAELLIFIAQTGMNLAQAKDIRRETYRWKSDGDDLLAFQVYKARRQGEAVFRCFKVYRAHLKAYLKWLDDVGFGASDDRLFPFVYLDKIPPRHAAPEFAATRRLCASLDIAFFGPQALRNTRINWLLRRSRDPDLTADQAGHAKQTLLRVYEKPHHQSAAAEITRFHAATDAFIAAAGPGGCASELSGPIALAGIPEQVPLPDCVSPEGCLFCVHHRDVLSADYCWMLASQARLKSLELSLYKPSAAHHEHPALNVILRIRAKLEAIAEGGEVRRQWVQDADDRVRAGRYHHEWDGHIQLLEVFA